MKLFILLTDYNPKRGESRMRWFVRNMPMSYEEHWHSKIVLSGGRSLVIECYEKELRKKGYHKNNRHRFLGCIIACSRWAVKLEIDNQEDQEISISEERDRSESLLLNILSCGNGGRVGKTQGESWREGHDMVSILFTDFIDLPEILQNERQGSGCWD